MLNTGASVEWHTQLKTFMNSPEGNMDATAILDYFSPLQEFLADFIKENDIEVSRQRSSFNSECCGVQE